jgi:hypothetical protein
MSTARLLDQFAKKEFFGRLIFKITRVLKVRELIKLSHYN